MRLKFLSDDPLEGGSAGAAHFEPVVVFAGHVVAFEDFGHGLNALQERLAGLRVAELYGDVGEQAATDAFGFELGVVAPDGAAFLEFAGAFGDGGSGQAEVAREFGPGAAGVAL